MRFWLVLPLLAACQKAPGGNAAPAPSASVPAAATSASAPRPAERAWYEGSWQGDFHAEPFRIELPVGGVKEWKQDDGKRASGAATLKLEIGRDGRANGTASGALGELVASGHVEADRLALSLGSPSGDGFHGFVLASQTPDGMRGTLSASSADSLIVRRADVTLTRAKP